MRKTFFFLLAVLFFGLGLSCGNSQPGEAPKTISRDTSILPGNSYSELFFDSLDLERFLETRKLPDTARSLMRNFYNQRNFQYAWFDSSGLAEQAGAFWNLQENYIAYSGDSSIYNPFLQGWADSALAYGKNAIPSSIRPEVEWQLTLQFFRYAAKAYMGDRHLNERDLQWFIPRKKADILSLLDTLIKEKGKSISSYEPVNRQYQLLREELKKYHTIQAEGGWQPLVPKKKKYQLGDSLPEISQIKHRLYLTGDFNSPDTSDLFTPELEAAVKGFQRRYGMKEDGAIGGGTLREMNQPIENRIKQILVNMERIRWVPEEPKGDYVLVNIPEFKAHIYEQGKLVFDMNVVVGTTQNNTVIFTGKLKHVVFSPYWNVPPGILKNEVLPGIKRNPNYLARHNMKWNGGQVRQKPGPSNSLGLVKFLFPNSYNIYLHDTPSKSLFKQEKRAFSHGCIRVSEPKKFAQWILRDEASWTDDAINAAMNAGKEKYVTVKKDINVFIGYFTAWVDRDGKLNFRDDIYGHDKRMADKMFGK
ncbi:L,D-transpeptidase family protein [Flavihumibacter rivuli]|uniref:L,D-transpeptidase family protein n=1 Tax=Flavihumibacter rivuli TaxID=2838156 RepID=UPI001BDF6E11|nr:L,D-transpeptidase family protein [Flavihumibacter rivuli]ULQ56517.1 L,D-transpeptidase family protein [Flavihumibacter rivuli]